MNKPWKIAVITAILAAGILGGTRPAQAHDVTILRSDPADGAVLAAAPTAAQIWFAEELAAEGSSLQMFDAAGTQVDLKDGGLDPADNTHTSLKVSLPALGNGVYVARWTAVLPDGDSVVGTFQFTVETPAYPAAAPAVPTAAAVDSAYPAGGSESQAGSIQGRIENIFSNRDSLLGAAIGGLAILLGLLVLIKKLTGGKA